MALTLVPVENMFLLYEGLKPGRLFIPVDGVTINNSLCDSCALQGCCVLDNGYSTCNAYDNGKRYYEITDLVPAISQQIGVA